jgi:transposase
MSHKAATTVAPTIGIDTGKNTLHLIGLDGNGTIVLREKIARGRIAARFANVPRCLIELPFHSRSLREQPTGRPL